MEALKIYGQDLQNIGIGPQRGEWVEKSDL